MDKDLKIETIAASAALAFHRRTALRFTQRSRVRARAEAHLHRLDDVGIERLRSSSSTPEDAPPPELAAEPEGGSAPSWPHRDDEVDAPELLALRRLADSPSFALPPRFRQTVRDAAGIDAPTTVQIHTGAVADAIARRYGADAVTVGQHLAFRAGQYGHRPEQVALLGHELAHATARDESETPAQRARAEARAQVVERRVLAAETREPRSTTAPRAPRATEPRMRTAPPSPIAPPSPPASVAAPVAPSPTVHLAAEARPESPPAPEPVGPVDQEAMMDEIYRYILARMRTEFERGA